MSLMSYRRERQLRQQIAIGGYPTTSMTPPTSLRPVSSSSSSAIPGPLRPSIFRQPTSAMPGSLRPFQHGSSHSLSLSVPPARPFTLFPSHSRPYTPPTFPPTSSLAPASPPRPRASFDSLMGFLSARPGQREVIELDDDGDISSVCHFNGNASSPASSLQSSSSTTSLFSEAGSTSAASSIDDQDTDKKTESQPSSSPSWP
ncbi:hypothetical protein C8J56DRAFT_1042204 [Mycena floridula]|nr:hypothetical protein C8J56DRAFT_1042204 [Mycena floridula]